MLSRNLECRCKNCKKLLFNWKNSDTIKVDSMVYIEIKCNRCNSINEIVLGEAVISV